MADSETEKDAPETSDHREASVASGLLFPEPGDAETDLDISPPSESPSTDPAGRERIELPPRENQQLHRVADAIGLPPREVLKHLLKYVSQQIRHGSTFVDGNDDAKRMAAGERPDATLALRRIPVGPVDRQRISRWKERTDRTLSELVRYRIRELATEIADGRLEDTTPQHPLEAYQLLIDILHEHDDASGETSRPSKQE